MLNDAYIEGCEAALQEIEKVAGEEMAEKVAGRMQSAMNSVKSGYNAVKGAVSKKAGKIKEDFQVGFRGKEGPYSSGMARSTAENATRASKARKRTYIRGGLAAVGTAGAAEGGRRYMSDKK